MKGKLKVQNGAGKAVEETFSRANSLAARRVVIVIRSGDTIIVIIIRTRT